MARRPPRDRRPGSRRSTTRSPGAARGRRRSPRDRWVGIHWPAAYGGRRPPPVEVALSTWSTRGPGAPQPVNRVGINLAGPTLLAHGTEEQKQRWLPVDPRRQPAVVPAVLRARRRLATSRRCDPGRRPSRRAGWLVSGQKVWTSYAPVVPVGDLPGAHRPRRAGAPRHLVPGRRHREPRRRRPPAASDHRARPSSTRCSSTRCSCRSDQLVGGLHQGWAVASTTLAARAGHDLPVQGAGRARGLPRRALALAAATGALDDVEAADALAQSFVDLRVLRLHNWRTLSRPHAGPRAGTGVELGEARLDRHDPAPVRAAIELCGPAAPLWRGAEEVPADGKWQRQWLWSGAASIAGGTSEIQKNIVAERILGLPALTWSAPAPSTISS